MANRRGRPIIHWHKYRYDESHGKWIKKKRYKHPVITVVKLDPDQALLAPCKIDGGYLDRGPIPYICKTRSAGYRQCVFSPKGRQYATNHTGVGPDISGLAS